MGEVFEHCSLSVRRVSGGNCREDPLVHLEGVWVVGAERLKPFGMGFLQGFDQGLKDQQEDLVAAGFCYGAVKSDVCRDRLGSRTGFRKETGGGTQVAQVAGGCPGGSKGCGFRFKNLTEFEELDESGLWGADQECEASGDGLVEVLNDAGGFALMDLEKALEFELTDGLAEGVSGKAELGGESAFGGKGLEMGLGLDEGDEFFGGEIDAGEGFGEPWQDGHG
ncbi:MAG: hypothetical protein RLZZ253_584 [Verrucomicrobiota bacterium]|jgi:hypothetical protein